MSPHQDPALTAVDGFEIFDVSDPAVFDRPDPPRLNSATIRLWNAFAPLAPERRRWALATGAVQSFEAGEACRVSGEVAVIVSGCLGTGAGESQLTADILGPGDILATGSSRTVSSRWITEGELYRVGLDAWMETAGAEGQTHLLAVLDDRRAVLERRILCATTHRATARIADLLLSVHEAAPSPVITLSQERLGEMLGLRRTTVNGSCRALEISRASRTRRGQIRIVDVEALHQAACGCRCASRTPPSPDVSART